MSKDAKGMEHKLLIEIEYQKPRMFSKLLKEKEFPRGMPLNLKFNITNIGEQEFPGGIFKQVSINYDAGTSGGGLKTFRNFEIPIESIKPKNKVMAFNWKTTFMLSGLTWLRCEIKPKDEKDTIRFYQLVSEEGSKEWQNGYTVIDRENLVIINKLEDIINKLD